MSKEPSKVEQRRALAEAQYNRRMEKASAAAPPAAEDKPPAVIKQKPAPRPAAVVADIQAAVDKIEPNPSRKKKLQSHPDCAVCQATREKAKGKMRAWRNQPGRKLP